MNSYKWPHYAIDLRQDPGKYTGADPFDDPFIDIRTKHRDWFEASTKAVDSDPHAARALRAITEVAVQRFAFHPDAVRLLIFSLLENFVFGVYQHRQLPREYLTEVERIYSKRLRAAQKEVLRWGPDVKVWEELPRVPAEFIPEDEECQCVCWRLGSVLMEGGKRQQVWQALNDYIAYMKQQLKYNRRQMAKEPNGRDTYALVRLCTAVSILTDRRDYPQITHLLNAVTSFKTQTGNKPWEVETLRRTVHRYQHDYPQEAREIWIYLYAQCNLFVLLSPFPADDLVNNPMFEYVKTADGGRKLIPSPRYKTVLPTDDRESGELADK